MRSKTNNCKRGQQKGPPIFSADNTFNSQIKVFVPNTNFRLFVRAQFAWGNQFTFFRDFCYLASLVFRVRLPDAFLIVILIKEMTMTVFSTIICSLRLLHRLSVNVVHNDNTNLSGLRMKCGSISKLKEKAI